MEGMQSLAVAAACRPEPGCNPVAGGLDDQPIDWDVLSHHVLVSLGAFQFPVERLDVGNTKYYAEMGVAARVAAASRAVAHQEQARQEQAQQELARQELARQEQAQLELAQLEQARREQAQQDQARREQAQQEQARQEQAQLEEQARLEQAQLEEQAWSWRGSLELEEELEEQAWLEQVQLEEQAWLEQVQQELARLEQVQQELARETSLSPQPVQQQMQEQRITPPVLLPPLETEQIDLAPPQRDSPVCSPTAFTGSVSNNGGPAVAPAGTPQQPEPVAPSSAMPSSFPSLPFLASAPPALHAAPRTAVGYAVSQQLFDEPMQLNENFEPTEPVVPDDEYEPEPSSQCTPIPAEAAKPPKLSIRTPMEGVPELHHSALRDTPSRASVPPPDLAPPEHIAGVPETNVHLPFPGAGLQVAESPCPQPLPPTPPSQMEGVPEVHLSAWAPPAQPRLAFHEDAGGEGMVNADVSAHEPNENVALAASSAHVPNVAASISPPHSRITHPTLAPSFSYAIPDHPVLLHSNPSPVLSPRSRLIRESADGDDSLTPAVAPQGVSPALPHAAALDIPPCADNNSSRPSTAEGSISLNEAVSPTAADARNAEVSAGPWYMVPTGLTPEGYMNAAVGTTPVNFPLPLCEQEQGVAPSDAPPSSGTRQRRAATGSHLQQSEPPSPAGARAQHGRSSKRKAVAATSHEGGTSKKSRSTVRSIAAGTDAATDAAAPSVAKGSGSVSERSRSTRSGKSRSTRSGNAQENLASEPDRAADGSDRAGQQPQQLAPVAELTEEALGLHGGRRWGPAGEGCSRWLETNSGDGAACDAGPENDQDLWCGDDLAGDDFGGHDEGFESEDFPEDPLSTPRDERQPSQSHEAARGKQQAALVAMPVTDDITPVPADFAADSEQHHDPSGNGLSGGAGLPFVESALVADVRQSSAQGSHQTLKSILKTGKSSGSAGQASILRASKRSGGQENVPGSGNAVERRTPHFAPLPQSDGPPFSEGPGGHGDLDDMSQSDQPSQEEGDENKVNKKMTRVAKSLMSQHLRRKSLVMAGTKEVDGRRVSTRRKMKPLRWWCSEKKTYGRKHQSLPTVTAVIRTEQKSAQYRGLKNPADSFQAHTEAWDTK